MTIPAPFPFSRSLMTFAAFLAGVSPIAASPGHDASVPTPSNPVSEYTTVLPPVAREGRHLLVNGKPWAFLGLNYTRFLLEFSLRTDRQRVADDLRDYADWGITVLRVPLHLGMFQPRPGVFPDAPEYREVLESHRLDPEFFNLFEHFVALAGHHGIRVVIDWHEAPDDPYRYFVGGNLNEKAAGQPGKGIAWLHDPETGATARRGDADYTRAIADTNRWLARRFKGDGNLLGFEAPYNEPHDLGDSTEAAWRRIAAATTLPIVTEDPERLVFGMPPAWGHDNVLASVTWLPPDHLAGMAPHHYLANGPVPMRPDAHSRAEPWTARDVAATFDHAFFAAALPHSAAPVPVWNGESGEHGRASFLPDMDHREAAAYMIEAQFVQAYAAGWTGCLGWTLTGHETVYQPVRDLYEQAYRRFAPVYAAGPVDQTRARILFVQNPAAAPVDNGLNHACVPFARLILDLHLAPVHYMTDDQLIGTGLAQQSAGFEQAESAVAGLPYRAAIIDRRNLDARALDLVKRAGIPMLAIDDAAELTATQLAGFLQNAGLSVDTRTPAELQLIAGPEHLLVYRRSGEDASARVYPRLEIDGPFQLIAEDNRVVFAGATGDLAENGIALDLPKWRTAIFRIQPTP